MERISRYILILITILASSVAIPGLYWMAFEKPIREPFILYSCMNHDFMIRRSGEATTWEDRQGNSYTRETYEEQLPMLYYMQLAKNGTMPDTINGVEMDMHVLMRARSVYRYKPQSLHSPDPGLYPMFESESGRVRLEMPEDYFRIGKRMEFVDAKTNKIEEKKSIMFTIVLQNREFAFPAKIIAGLPTTRKSCDEGYLVTDSNGDLYHVKMVEGEPYVVKVEKPEGLVFKKIDCVDFSNKMYYAYLYSTNNEVFILTQEDYELEKLPVEGFDLEDCELRIYGDLFNYNVIISGNDFVKVIVLDDLFNKVDEYKETWLPREKRTEGKVFSTLFPAQIRLTDRNSNFIDFYFQASKGWSWIIISLVLIGVQFFLISRRKSKLKRNVIDLILILFTGIYGFIAVNIFPNKFYS